MKKISSLFTQSQKIIHDVGKKGFFHLLSANILIQATGFASQFFVAWILTPADIGTIKLLQSYANIASIAASFGFNSSVLKLCSESRSFPERKYLYSIAVRYTIASSFVTLILFIVASRLGIFSSDTSLFPYFTIYGFIVVALALNNLQSSYLQALKKIQLMSKIQASTKLVTIFLIIGMTFFLKLDGYFTAILIGSYIAIGVFFFRIRSLHSEYAAEIHANGFRLHWFYAKYSFLSNFVYQIYLAIDVILVNRLVTDKTNIGFYSFALMLIIPFEVLRGTVQQIVTPYFSQKADDRKEYSRVITKYNKLLLVLSICVATIAVTIVPPFIHFVFIGKYDSSVGFYQILMIAWTIRCFYSIKSYAIWGLGKIDINFLIVLLTIVPSLLMIYYLIKIMGTTGAAIGVIGSELVLLVINEYFFRKYLK
jgi:O-antigen/teichoic acid export membrane protein